MPALDDAEPASADPARRPSGCRRPTSTPPTSGSPGRAPASATATTRAGRSSCRSRPTSRWSVPRSTSAATPGEPPDAAVDLVQALLRDAPLELAARLNTARHRVVLRDRRRQAARGAGRRRGVGARRRPARRHASASSRWSSATLPPPSSSSAVADRLRAAGAGEPEPRPQDRARPRPPRARPARPRRTAEARLRVDARATCSAPRSRRSTLRLLANDPGVRLGDDPEDGAPGPRRHPAAPLRPAHLPPGHRPGVGRPHCARS